MLCRYYLAESGRVKDKSASAATIARRSLCSQTRRQAEEETRREDFHACVIDTSPKGQRERKPKPLLALRASVAHSGSHHNSPKRQRGTKTRTLARAAGEYLWANVQG